MASSRTKDRLIGVVIGVVLALVLLVVAVTVAFFVLSGDTTAPDSSAGGTPAPPSPPPAGAATPPDDLAQGETWLGDIDLEAARLVTTEADLRDVDAVGSDVLTGPDGTRVGTLEVEATVPFAVVAERLGPGTTVGAAQDGQASVRRGIDLFGRELEVVATGTVEAVDGRLVVEPRTIVIGGSTFVAEALASAARELIVIEQDVEGLPEGLVLRDVAVVDDGFRARLDGEDVLISPAAAP